MYYKVGTKEFKTKSEIKKHYSNIVSIYNWGDNLSADHHQDACDLLDLHPNKNEKIGKGLSHIEVRRELEQWNTKCFFAISIDGIATSFSFNGVIKHLKKQND